MKISPKTLIKAVISITGILILVGLILYLSGFFGRAKIEPGTFQPVKEVPEPLVTAIVKTTTHPIWYEAVGTVQSKSETTIAPQVTGRIMDVSVDDGDRINSGDLIATLDSEEITARLKQARSGVDSANAIRVQANAAFKRIQKLFQQNAATQEQLEAAEAAKMQADAGLAAAEQRLEEVKVMISYTRIVSPLNGVVRKREVEPGDLAWPGKPLVILHDPQNLRLEASIREGLINKVKIGDRVRIEISALNEEMDGTIDDIVPLADPVSRSFIIKVSFPSVEGIYPGMFGKIKIQTGDHEAVLIPRPAITEIGQLQTVRVKQNDRWIRRYVTTSTIINGSIEILSGLQGGETIGWDGDGLDE